jgi:hypothetical protein
MKEYILWLFAFVYVMEFMFVPWLIISYSPVMLFQTPQPSQSLLVTERFCQTIPHEKPYRQEIWLPSIFHTLQMHLTILPGHHSTSSAQIVWVFPLQS